MTIINWHCIHVHTCLRTYTLIRQNTFDPIILDICHDCPYCLRGDMDAHVVNDAEAITYGDKVLSYCEGTISSCPVVMGMTLNEVLEQCRTIRDNPPASDSEEVSVDHDG